MKDAEKVLQDCLKSEKDAFKNLKYYRKRLRGRVSVARSLLKAAYINSRIARSNFDYFKDQYEYWKKVSEGQVYESHL